MKEINIKKEKFIYLVLIAIIIFSILPWFKEGMPYTDDFRHHITKFWWIKYSFEHYGKIVEWMPLIYSGWPLTHFYHSLPYFLSLPFILFMNAVTALKASIVTSFILSAIAMFFAAKKLTGKNEIAAIAPIFYTLAPMHFEFAYLSGSLSRLWTYVFLPLAFVYFIKMIEDGSKKDIITTGILFAALVYTNINVAFTLSIVLFIYLIYHFIIKEKKINYKTFKNLMLTALITIGIISFWLIPFALENDQSSAIGQATKAFGGNPGSLSYKSLFIRDFGIKPSDGENVRYFYIGFSLILFAVISFFIKKFEYRNVFVLLAILCIFIATNTWVLKIVPFSELVSYTQYFILVAIVILSILAAIGIYSLSKINKNSSYLIILIPLILFVVDVYPAQSTYNWSNLPIEQYLNNNQILEAYNFIKNQSGLFRVYSVVGEISYMYTEKQEIGLEWTGFREGAFKPIRSLTDELLNSIRNNISDVRSNQLLGYMGTKYHIYPCLQNFDKNFKKIFTNDATCIYENPYFEPIVESPRKIIKSDTPQFLEKQSAVVLEKCETNCIDDVKPTEIENITFEPEKITFRTNGKGYVLVKSAYFKPHWHAYVNNKEVQIRLAWPYYMLIEVPEGASDVIFKYQTNINHIAGWLISILTVIALIYWGRK